MVCTLCFDSSPFSVYSEALATCKENSNVNFYRTGKKPLQCALV